MSSCVGHVTTETVFGQTLALRLGDRDEHCALESDTTGPNVKGNLYLYLGEIMGAMRASREEYRREGKSGIHGFYEKQKRCFFSVSHLSYQEEFYDAHPNSASKQGL